MMECMRKMRPLYKDASNGDSNPKMYGLLLEGFRNYIEEKYDKDTWLRIIKLANLETSQFGMHDMYGEGTFLQAVRATSQLTKLSQDDLLFDNGKHFIKYIARYNYDGMLKVLGRNLTDFINGLDNLHEYLRFTYPKLKPPSFFCVNESKTGITLQYRTRRIGFKDYVRGQITEIARTLYQIELKTEIVCIIEKESINTTIIRLHFNNQAFLDVDDPLKVPSEVFFEVFPFNLVFDRGLKVINAGKGMLCAIPDIQGKMISEVFMLTRPMIDFTWDGVMLHTNNVFELVNVSKREGNGLEELAITDSASRRRTLSRNEQALKVRGQMKYMLDWDAIVFLGTPIMRDVDSMWRVGLFLNDLSMHDSSRDLVLAGEQQSAELKLAMEQENEKGKRLEESFKKLDEEMKRTDELLYQMIPKVVADRLRTGQKAVNTCETFEEVTILFSDVVGFTTICSRMTPLDVVNMLNDMYSVFDQLTEKHKVYKVETIGDAYMITAGCPTRTKWHAALIAEMALDMIDSIKKIKDYSVDPPESLRIRVGIHSGSAVAGVVGIKMPRYCLFGETVNTASKMESSGSPEKIQISHTTKQNLSDYGVYNLTERLDSSNPKTYWLEGHKNSQSDGRNLAKFISKLDKERERMGDSNMSSTQKTQGESWESQNTSRVSSARTLGSRRGSIKPHLTGTTHKN
ncbi:hypothetical protein Ciccas_005546 [Cichlidogyrus casuarinus]|uniref:guanylate cyclase n=1 Tax=Cichlidogyrus casuarinus TaxID=1844966 RepID=A0ABD2QAQ2_9PLAT